MQKKGILKNNLKKLSTLAMASVFLGAAFFCVVSAIPSKSKREKDQQEDRAKQEQVLGEQEYML